MHEQKFIRKTIFLFCPSLLKNVWNECSVASSDLNDLLTSLHLSLLTSFVQEDEPHPFSQT